MNRVGHQAEAYPGFCSMDRQGVFLLSPRLDASPLRGYPSIKFAGISFRHPLIHLRGERHCRSKQESDTISPAKLKSALPGGERTNHEACEPPTVIFISITYSCVVEVISKAWDSFLSGCNAIRQWASFLINCCMGLRTKSCEYKPADAKYRA